MVHMIDSSDGAEHFKENYFNEENRMNGNRYMSRGHRGRGRGRGRGHSDFNPQAYGRGYNMHGEYYNENEYYQRGSEATDRHSNNQWYGENRSNESAHRRPQDLRDLISPKSRRISGSPGRERSGPRNDDYDTHDYNRDRQHTTSSFHRKSRRSRSPDDGSKSRTPDKRKRFQNSQYQGENYTKPSDSKYPRRSQSPYSSESPNMARNIRSSNNYSRSSHKNGRKDHYASREVRKNTKCSPKNDRRSRSLSPHRRSGSSSRRRSSRSSSRTRRQRSPFTNRQSKSVSRKARKQSRSSSRSRRGSSKSSTGSLSSSSSSTSSSEGPLSSNNSGSSSTGPRKTSRKRTYENNLSEKSSHSDLNKNRLNHAKKQKIKNDDASRTTTNTVYNFETKQWSDERNWSDDSKMENRTPPQHRNKPLLNSNNQKRNIQNKPIKNPFKWINPDFKRKVCIEKSDPVGENTLYETISEESFDRSEPDEIEQIDQKSVNKEENAKDSNHSPEDEESGGGCETPLAVSVEDKKNERDIEKTTIVRKEDAENDKVEVFTNTERELDNKRESGVGECAKSNSAEVVTKIENGVNKCAKNESQIDKNTKVDGATDKCTCIVMDNVAGKCAKTDTDGGICTETHEASKYTKSENKCDKCTKTDPEIGKYINTDTEFGESSKTENQKVEAKTSRDLTQKSTEAVLLQGKVTKKCELSDESVSSSERKDRKDGEDMETNNELLSEKHLNESDNSMKQLYHAENGEDSHGTRNEKKDLFDPFNKSIKRFMQKHAPDSSMLITLDQWSAIMSKKFKQKETISDPTLVKTNVNVQMSDGRQIANISEMGVSTLSTVATDRSEISLKEKTNEKETKLCIENAISLNSTDKLRIDVETLSKIHAVFETEQGRSNSNVNEKIDPHNINNVPKNENNLDRTVVKGYKPSSGDQMKELTSLETNVVQRNRFTSVEENRGSGAEVEINSLHRSSGDEQKRDGHGLDRTVGKGNRHSGDIRTKERTSVQTNIVKRDIATKLKKGPGFEIKVNTKCRSSTDEQKKEHSLDRPVVKGNKPSIGDQTKEGASLETKVVKTNSISSAEQNKKPALEVKIDTPGKSSNYEEKKEHILERTGVKRNKHSSGDRIKEGSSLKTKVVKRNRSASLEQYVDSPLELKIVTPRRSSSDEQKRDGCNLDRTVVKGNKPSSGDKMKELTSLETNVVQRNRYASVEQNIGSAAEVKIDTPHRSSSDEQNRDGHSLDRTVGKGNSGDDQTKEETSLQPNIVERDIATNEELKKGPGFEIKVNTKCRSSADEQKKEHSLDRPVVKGNKPSSGDQTKEGASLETKVVKTNSISSAEQNKKPALEVKIDTPGKSSNDEQKKEHILERTGVKRNKHSSGDRMKEGSSLKTKVVKRNRSASLEQNKDPTLEVKIVTPSRSSSDEQRRDGCNLDRTVVKGNKPPSGDQMKELTSLETDIGLRNRCASVEQNVGSAAEVKIDTPHRSSSDEQKRNGHSLGRTVCKGNRHSVDDQTKEGTSLQTNIVKRDISRNEELKKGLGFEVKVNTQCRSSADEQKKEHGLDRPVVKGNKPPSGVQTKEGTSLETKVVKTNSISSAEQNKKPALEVKIDTPGKSSTDEQKKLHILERTGVKRNKHSSGDRIKEGSSLKTKVVKRNRSASLEQNVDSPLELKIITPRRSSSDEQKRDGYSLDRTVDKGNKPSSDDQMEKGTPLERKVEKIKKCTNEELKKGPALETKVDTPSRSLRHEQKNDHSLDSTVVEGNKPSSVDQIKEGTSLENMVVKRKRSLSEEQKKEEQSEHIVRSDKDKLSDSKNVWKNNEFIPLGGKHTPNKLSKKVDTINRQKDESAENSSLSAKDSIEQSGIFTELQIEQNDTVNNTTQHFSKPRFEKLDKNRENVHLSEFSGNTPEQNQKQMLFKKNKPRVSHAQPKPEILTRKEDLLKKLRQNPSTKKKSLTKSTAPRNLSLVTSSSKATKRFLFKKSEKKVNEDSDDEQLEAQKISLQRSVEFHDTQESENRTSNECTNSVNNDKKNEKMIDAKSALMEEKINKTKSDDDCDLNNETKACKETYEGSYSKGQIKATHTNLPACQPSYQPKNLKLHSESTSIQASEFNKDIAENSTSSINKSQRDKNIFDSLMGEINCSHMKQKITPDQNRETVTEKHYSDFNSENPESNSHTTDAILETEPCNILEIHIEELDEDDIELIDIENSLPACPVSKVDRDQEKLKQSIEESSKGSSQNSADRESDAKYAVKDFADKDNLDVANNTFENPFSPALMPMTPASPALRQLAPHIPSVHTLFKGKSQEETTESERVALEYPLSPTLMPLTPAPPALRELAPNIPPIHSIFRQDEDVNKADSETENQLDTNQDVETVNSPLKKQVEKFMKDTHCISEKETCQNESSNEVSLNLTGHSRFIDDELFYKSEDKENAGKYEDKHIPDTPSRRRSRHKHFGSRLENASRQLEDNNEDDTSEREKDVSNLEQSSVVDDQNMPNSGTSQNTNNTEKVSHHETNVDASSNSSCLTWLKRAKKNLKTPQKDRASKDDDLPSAFDSNDSKNVDTQHENIDKATDTSNKKVVYSGSREERDEIEKEKQSHGSIVSLLPEKELLTTAVFMNGFEVCHTKVLHSNTTVETVAHLKPQKLYYESGRCLLCQTCSVYFTPLAFTIHHDDKLILSDIDQERSQEKEFSFLREEIQFWNQSAETIFDDFLKYFNNERSRRSTVLKLKPPAVLARLKSKDSQHKKTTKECQQKETTNESKGTCRNAESSSIGAQEEFPCLEKSSLPQSDSAAVLGAEKVRQTETGPDSLTPESAAESPQRFVSPAAAIQHMESLKQAGQPQEVHRRRHRSKKQESWQGQQVQPVYQPNNAHLRQASAQNMPQTYVSQNIHATISPQYPQTNIHMTNQPYGFSPDQPPVNRSLNQRPEFNQVRNTENVEGLLQATGPVPIKRNLSQRPEFNQERNNGNFEVNVPTNLQQPAGPCSYGQTMQQPTTSQCFIGSKQSPPSRQFIPLAMNSQTNQDLVGSVPQTFTYTPDLPSRSGVRHGVSAASSAPPLPQFAPQTVTTHSSEQPVSQDPSSATYIGNQPMYSVLTSSLMSNNIPTVQQRSEPETMFRHQSGPSQSNIPATGSVAPRVVKQLEYDCISPVPPNSRYAQPSQATTDDTRANPTVTPDVTQQPSISGIDHPDTFHRLLIQMATEVCGIRCEDDGMKLLLLGQLIQSRGYSMLNPDLKNLLHGKISNRK